MQHRFVASDSRLQNRKKPNSDKGKFCNETVRRCKKSDGLCLMRKISKRSRVAKPPCKIPQWSFKNSLKKHECFPWFYRIFSQEFLRQNSFPLTTPWKKRSQKAVECPIFFNSTDPTATTKETHQRSCLMPLRAYLKLTDRLDFYFWQKFAEKWLRKQEFQKQAL